MFQTTTEHEVPQIPEPPNTTDQTLDEYHRRVKDAINQLHVIVDDIIEGGDIFIDIQNTIINQVVEQEFAHGGLYVAAGSTVQTFDSDFAKLTGFTTAMEEEQNVTATPGTDNITIGEVEGVYVVQAQFSFAGSASTEFHIHIFKNSTDTGFGCHRVIGTGGDVGSASIVCLLNLVEDDLLDIRIKQDSGGTKNFTLENGQFMVARV